VGEYGEPPLQNEPPSIKLKIRKILMPSKSSEEKSENKIISNTFVVGSGVEPLAHRTSIQLLYHKH